MKKLFFIMLAAVCMTFVGCKKSPKQIIDSDMTLEEKFEALDELALKAVEDKDAKTLVEALEAQLELNMDLTPEDLEDLQSYQKKAKKTSAKIQKAMKQAMKDKKFKKEFIKELENSDVKESLGALSAY